jgi:deazaflavin-dependent oxidoreductase (nitroreductase family)
MATQPNKLSNSFMAWLLRSPLHGFISRNFMLITFTGRKSGKTYSTPVNYVRDGDDLWVTSFRERTWWRNLRSSAPVTVHLAGQDLKGSGEAFTAENDVTTKLSAYLQKVPQVARYFNVALDATGQPNRDDVMRAAHERVMVRIHLTPELAHV